MSGLREAIVRRWDRLWHPERRESAPYPDARRRQFWSEFREGQRQAEETSSRSAGRTIRHP